MILIGGERFSSVQPSEEILEGLLRTVGPDVFEGFRYYDFRPPIPSRLGTRHPDGALVAPGSSQWWVVEVELHKHDVIDHIGPQLAALADGMYGWEAFNYLDRYDTIDLADFAGVDVWQPSFLLVCDLVTPPIRDAAARTNFQVLEFATYRSFRNRYAVAVSGFRPSRMPTILPGGIDVRLEEAHGVTLLVPLEGRTLPAESGPVVVLGEQEARIRRMRDGSALVVPLAVDQVQQLVGEAERYRVTGDDRLMPADPTTSGPVEPKEENT
jgi:hypothetical protein